MLENLNRLLSKPYIEGLQDCYTLAQKYYAQEFGIVLKSYARPNLWYLSKEYDFFQKFFPLEGFVSQDVNPSNIRRGDTILFRIGRGPVANHCAVYVGQGKILHHLNGQPSKLEPYSQKWRVRAVLVLRHPEVEVRSPTLCLEVFKKAPHQVRVNLGVNKK